MSKRLAFMCLACAVLLAVLGYALTSDYAIEILDSSGRDMRTLKREVCDTLIPDLRLRRANAAVEDIVEGEVEVFACRDALVWQVYQLRRGGYGEKVPRITNWLRGGRRTAAVFDLERLSVDTKRAFRALTLENKPLCYSLGDTCLSESDWF